MIRTVDPRADLVVSKSAPASIVAATTFDDVVAIAAPEGVVVSAAEDAVNKVSRGAVIDSLTIDTSRVYRVRKAVADRAVRHTDENQILCTF